MIERFNQNRAAFERLIELAPPPEDISKPKGQSHRNKETDALTSQLKITGIYNTGDAIRLMCTSFENEFNGQKGYLFVRTEGELPEWLADRIVPQLDGIKPPSGETRYMKIADDWFLFYQAPSD